MSTKHTQGEWHFYTQPQPNGCPIVGNDRGLMVAMLAHSINHDDQREEALANAALISAAPDLLEALNECMRALRMLGHTDVVGYQLGTFAIRKAAGEQA